MAVQGPPFGATPAGARVLVQTVSEGDRPVGVEPVQRVDDAQLQTWIDEGAAEVAVNITGYDRLAEVDGQPTNPDLVEQIEVRARSLVHLYAASFLADATYPERAGRDHASYGAVLYQRYVDGLGRLTGDVEAHLERLGLLEPQAAVDVSEDDQWGPGLVAPTPFLRNPYTGSPIGF